MLTLLNISIWFKNVEFVYLLFFPLGVFDSLTPLLKPFDKEHAMLHVQHVNEIRKCIKEERERVIKVFLKLKYINRTLSLVSAYLKVLMKILF